MHQPPQRQVIVLDRAVLHQAVVPQEHVAPSPLVAVDEGGLDDVIREGGDERQGLITIQAFDAGGIVAHHVQALAPALRVGPDDEVLNGREAGDLGLRRREGSLPATEVERDEAPVDPLPE